MGGVNGRGKWEARVGRCEWASSVTKETGTSRVSVACCRVASHRRLVKPRRRRYIKRIPKGSIERTHTGTGYEHAKRNIYFFWRKYGWRQSSSTSGRSAIL